MKFFLLLNVYVCVVVGRNVMDQPDQHLEEKIEESFSEREVDCKDTYTSCTRWANNNECGDSFVKDNCKESCNRCGNTGCKDAFSKCKKWAKSGSGCNSAWMAKKCKKSCNECGNTDNTDTGNTDVGPPPKPKPGNARNNCGIKGNSGGNSYIVGGKYADEGEYPWQVLLQRYFQKFTNGRWVDMVSSCGGTIISPHCVLTAAHCVVEGGDLSVYAGVHNTRQLSSSNVQKRDVQKKNIFMYPGYYNNGPNDVAVLKIDKAFDFRSRYVNAACLPTRGSKQLYEGVEGTATGWGATSNRGSSSDILKEVSYKIRANSDPACPSANAVSSTLCAASSYKGTCSGDSGGPMVVKRDDDRWTVVGVNSFSPAGNCIKADYFMRVTSYMDFIKEHCA